LLFKIKIKIKIKIVTLYLIASNLPHQLFEISLY